MSSFCFHTFPHARCWRATKLNATERAPITTAVMLAFMSLTCGLMSYQSPSRWALGPTRTSRGRAAVSLSATPPNVLCVGECLFDALP